MNKRGDERENDDQNPQIEDQAEALPGLRRVGSENRMCTVKGDTQVGKKRVR